MTDAIALIVALAACVGVYLQWRSTRASERDIDLRIDLLNDLVARIEKERVDRETAVQHRIIEGVALRLEQSDGLIEAMGAGNDAIALRQLLLWTQVAALYITHQSRSATPEPDAQELYTLLITNTVNCIGAMNTLSQMSREGVHDQATDDRVRALAQDAVLALGRVGDQAKDMWRRLEAVGVFRREGDKPLEDLMVSMHLLLRPVLDVRDRRERDRQRLLNESERLGIPRGPGSETHS